MSSVLPAILIAALAGPAQQPPSAQDARTPASEPTPEMVISIPPGPGNVIWAKSPSEATERAARDGKYVFMEFATHQCGNCERMDTLIYPTPDLAKLLTTAVPVKIDLESDEGKSIASRYSIEEAPAVLIATPEGRLIFLMQGFTSYPEFFRNAYQATHDYETWSRKIASQDVAKLPAKEALESGNQLYRRTDAEAAIPRLKRAATAPGAPATLKEDALEVLAAAQLDVGRTADSRKTIGDLLKTTKDKQRRERAELFRAQIPLAENRPDEALALFKKFQKDHPMSPHIQRVNQLIARLQERVAKP